MDRLGDRPLCPTDPYLGLPRHDVESKEPAPGHVAIVPFPFRTCGKGLWGLGNILTLCGSSLGGRHLIKVSGASETS